MPYRRLLLSFAMLLAFTSVKAESPGESPSDDLLDFLGQWQQVDGEWMDPTELQDISMLQQDRLKGEKHED